MFNDSDDSPASYVVGPQLLHFRDSSMQHVVTRQHLSWEDIIANKTRLPAPSIKVYDCNDTLINIHEHKALDGNNSSADITSNDSVSHTALQPTPSDSNVTMENSINNFELAETTECQTTTINSCAAVSHTTLQSRSSDSISALDNSTELTETTECQTTTSESNDSISSQTTLQPPLLDSNAFGIQHNSDILQLKTKVGKAIAMCLGATKEVMQLDLLRYKLKEKQHKKQQCDTQDIKSYQVLLLHMKQKVTTLHKDYQKNLLATEYDFFLAHGHVPVTSADTDSWKDLVKKKTYVANLLQMWDNMQ